MSMQAVDKENALVQLQVEKERRQVKEARAKIKARLEDSPKMRCEFNNNEDPPDASSGQSIKTVEFSYEGVPYKVKHGDIVNWPEEVVSHVNSLTTPIYRDEVDPITGAIKSVPAGHVRRFTCLPLAEPRGGIGRTAPPKKERVNG